MPRQEPGVAPRARAWLPSGISSFLFVDRQSLPNRDDEVTPAKRPRRPLLAAAFLLWLIVVGVGLGRLWAYAQTPGPAAHASALWPAATALVRDTHRPTLLVFAHPQCPCSRATIGELAILMAQARDRVTAYVIFYRPLNVEAGWEQTDLWRSAAAIPGVRVVPDENGAGATVFDAATSGQTLLYDADGRLIFSGGMTGARGHSGDNAGRTALTALLNGGRSATSQTPVFGCLLGTRTN